MSTETAHDVCASSPDVGSSRNTSSRGRAASSTPMPLPLLDVEALARDADDGPGEGAHLEGVDDVLDVPQLLVTRCRGRLAEDGAELQGLADCCGLQVEVLLLDVAYLVLERRGVCWGAVDEGLAADDADGDAGCENVEERRLAGAGYALRKLKSSVDIIQEPAFSASLDFDIVADVFPVEDRVARRESTTAAAVAVFVEHTVFFHGRDWWTYALPLSLYVTVWRCSSGLSRSETGLDLAPAKDQYLAPGLGRPGVLGSEQVGCEEDDGEGAEDADVAPPPKASARYLSPLTTDEPGSAPTTEQICDPGGRSAYPGPRGTMAAHPNSRPWNSLAISASNEYASGLTRAIHRDQRGMSATGTAEQRARDHGLVRGPRDAGQGAEHGRLGEGGEQRDEAEEEEGRRRAPEVRHEVDEHVEDEHVGELVGQVAQVARDGLGGRAVEGVAADVLLDDGALGVDGEHLELAAEGVEHEGEEEEAAARVEARRVGREGVEHAAEDEGHDEVEEEGGDGEGRVGEEAAPRPPEGEGHLLAVGDGVRRAGSLRLGLLGAPGALVFREPLTRWVLLLVGRQLAEQLLPLPAFLPPLVELVRRPGHQVLEAGPRAPLVRAGHGRQEVRHRLPLWAAKPQLLKVRPGVRPPAEEYLPALVDDGDPVEEVEGRLRRLVEADGRADAEEVGLEAQGAAEGDGVGAVEAAGRIVPALEPRARERCLGDADALALATTDPADDVVADAGVGGVGEAECGHGDVAMGEGELRVREAGRDVADGAGVAGEGEGLGDGEVGEVSVEFGIVEDVAAKSGAD
ncbi:X-linked retinitis pigmentosa GTPase regulator isoform X1 [Colletotrichum higginsianum]|nr:X-linked retinitis pigmentosa GTPase regulator isoform X1 [Colletotrichum higginsianum]